MTALRAFHGDPAIKAKYLARVRMHRELDHLTQGVGWESDGETKGCAVGCTLDAYDHTRYPIEIGLPEWLAHIEDAIFEGLPYATAMAWPERFLTAIPVGADVEPVRHQLAIRRLDRLPATHLTEDVVAAINLVRGCHIAALHDLPCDWDAARSAAESAARSAARSAAYIRHAAKLLDLLRQS